MDDAEHTLTNRPIWPIAVAVVIGFFVAASGLLFPEWLVTALIGGGAIMALGALGGLTLLRTTQRAYHRVLAEQEIRVRIIESDRERAREVAEQLPHVRVLHATGIDPDFLERERIGRARAAIFAMRDDPKNLYAAVLTKLHGVSFTIAVVHDAVSIDVFEKAGVDRSVNPRAVTAEEMVRFAHDPRTQQVAMLEGDRFEVLDIIVRPESRLVNTPFRELPMTGSLIGALVRNGNAVFPHGDDILLPGDRVIVFTESARAAEVERAL